MSDNDTLLRHALRLAIIEADADEIGHKYQAAKDAAIPDFAAARNRGTPSQKVVLPDGTEVGQIVLYGGGRAVDVHEGELILHVATTEPGEIEEYALDTVLHDERVVALLNQHLPELVGRRINPKRRAQLQKELEENGGLVADQTTGEKVQVATITPLRATGKFRYNPSKQAPRLIREALEAGTLTRDGEIVGAAPSAEDGAPPAPPAEPRPETGRRTAGTVTVAAGKPARIPTDEQQQIIDAFMAGDSLVVEAGAGAAKTTTLSMAASAVSGRRGLYVAYNRAIADDARGSFPSSVRCSTAHALAMREVGFRYQHRLNGQLVPAREQAQVLNINSPVKVGDKTLAATRQARLAMETIGRFCRSADGEISSWHVPLTPGLDTPAVHKELAAVVVPAAQRAWADLTSQDGRLKFDHGHYLKMWQLSHPVLEADFILFDEAQDASPVILDVVAAQTKAQLVATGDRCQAINAWNGAIDAMDKFPATKRLTLSQSFRFGQAIAREANKWLGLLGADLQLRGFDRRSSMIATLENPDVILTRTNAEAMAQAMTVIEAGRKAAIVGGGDEIRALAEAARDLKAGRGTSHPQLFAFSAWSEVQDHVENDPTGSDLRVEVQLIDKHGPDKLIAMADELTDEKHAAVTISTAHKSKGREWNSVKIATDFRQPKGDPDDELPDIPDEMAMLAYVAVTRARLTLDRAGLAWVDRYLPGGGSNA